MKKEDIEQLLLIEDERVAVEIYDKAIQMNCTELAKWIEQEYLEGVEL